MNVSEARDSSSSDSDMDKESKGVSSDVCKAIAVTKRKFDGKEVDTLLSKISLGKNSDVPACNLFQSRTPYSFDSIWRGSSWFTIELPVSFIEHNYTVYCSFTKSPPSPPPPPPKRLMY